jgi:hypothetical protein
MVLFQTILEIENGIKIQKWYSAVPFSPNLTGKNGTFPNLTGNKNRYLPEIKIGIEKQKWYSVLFYSKLTGNKILYQLVATGNRYPMVLSTILFKTYRK